MEAPTDHYKLTILSLGPTGHVNLLLDVKAISSWLSDRLPIYKRPPYHNCEGSEAATKALNASPPPTIDGVDKLYY
jgi:hypothetical protein